MDIKKVPISEVDTWDKNPRNIKTKEFKRLKKQIKKLGVYKPLICYHENGRYITLGGNMRLRALKELGVKEVEISIVKAATESLKIQYALSDNDRAGEYDRQDLAELVYPHIEDINLEDFKLDIGEPISLKDVIEDYGPDIDGQDDVPEIEDGPAITKRGDLFKLKKHRLLCGDATKEEDVIRLMNGQKADMVFTDPPYDFKNYSFDSCFEYCSKDVFIMHVDKKFLEIFKKHGDKFRDFFGGSGSVLITCHKYRRINYVMEIEPKLCDLMIKRFALYSGIKEKEIRDSGREENQRSDHAI